MPIVSSVFAVGSAQADGRAYVTETHTDHLGAVYTTIYLANAGTDYAVVMAARVPVIELGLADAEFEAKIAA
jgi:hypothetical protein